MTNKYIKAGSLYMLGNVFDKALAFFTVPIFTKILSTTDYGIASTYLSWVSILTVIITLSVGNSLRTAVVDFKGHLKAYMSSIFVLGSLSSITITAIVVFISYLFDLMSPWWLVLCCCIQAYSISIIKAVDWKYVMELQYLKRTILQCIPNLIIVLLAILLIINREDEKYLGKIYAYVVIYGVVALGLFFVYINKGRQFYNKTYWKYALSFSLPIIFHSLSNVVLSQSDRIMITNIRHASETGLYSLAYQFGLIPLVLVTTLENLWIPWFTGKMQQNDYDSIHKMVKHYIMIVVACCVLCMLISPEILKVMTVETYYGAANMIAPIVLSTFFMFLLSIPLDMEYYYKRTGKIASNTLVAASCNIILNIIFIPKYGAFAAAYTTAISYALSFVMHYHTGRRIDGHFVPYTLYVPGVCLLLIATILVQISIDSWLLRWLMAVMILLVSIPYGLKLITYLKGSNK